MVAIQSPVINLISRLTDHVQVDERFSLAMLILYDHLVPALVLFAGALNAIFGLVNRGINVLDRQTGPLEEPLGISTRVSIIGHAHDKGFAGVCHQVLVCSFDLWNSYRKNKRTYEGRFFILFIKSIYNAPIVVTTIL